MPRDRMTRFGGRNSKVKHALRNPYFQRGKPLASHDAKRGLKSLLYGLGGAVALGVVMIVPFEAVTQPALAITTIQYQLSDLSTDRQSAIRTAVNDSLDKPFPLGISRLNYFLVPVGDIAKAISLTGNYEIVRVERELPHTLNITVAQPKKVFLATMGGVQAYVDGSGGAIDDVTKPVATSSTMQTTSSQMIPANLIRVSVLGSASSTMPAAGGEVVPKYCATLMQAIDQGSRKLGITPTSYTLTTDKTEIIQHTADGWDLLTDPIVTADDQLARLAAVLRDPRYKDRSKINYIDVRYPDRVYVKTR